MPRKAILTSQPGFNSLMPAYNPILISINSPGAEVMYCDVYFNHGNTVYEYYKTLTSTSPVSGIFTFDIQDAAQEYLFSAPPRYIFAIGVATDLAVITSCYCRLRDSTMVGGVIQQELPAPVQKTMDTPAISGGGMQTNSFFILNARLQHANQQDLLTHCSKYITRAATSGLTKWAVYPLTHRPDGYPIGRNDYDRFPVYINRLGDNPLQGLDLIIMTGNLAVTDIDTGISYLINNAYSQTFQRHNVYYLPTSPRLLELISGPGVVPWATVKRYRVLILQAAGLSPGVVRFFSPIFELVDNCDKETRLHFVNSLGCFDAITLKEREDTLRVTSSTWERGLNIVPAQKSYPLGGRGVSRFDVKSNLNTSATGYFKETIAKWLEELIASPIAFIEWRSGFEGQDDDYMPIVIHDGELINNKPEDDYEYSVSIEYELANPNVHLRN